MNDSLLSRLNEIKPKRLTIQTTDSIDALLGQTGREMLNGTTHCFFGSAMVQGGRLQFVTCMPVTTMTRLAKVHRAEKKSTVEAVDDRTNRPGEPKHEKGIRDYLTDTACLGEKFILPSFTLNFGLPPTEDEPEREVAMTLFDPGGSTKTVWPAMVSMPIDVKLHVTDGAHRDKALDAVFANRDKTASEAMLATLAGNGVDVKIVFEENMAAAHQDFADVGKTKPIANSLLVTYDKRDAKNRRVAEIVKAVPFLKYYVDATAKNINLSPRSAKLWSMNAVKLFVSQAVDHHERDPALEVDDLPDNRTETYRREQVAKKTQGAEDFFRALIRHIPQFRVLNEAIGNPDSEVSVGDMRELLGGDILLRGIGMAILARAFMFANKHKLPYDLVASKLAGVEWHVLTADRKKLEQLRDQSHPTAYVEALSAATRPLWSQVIAVFEQGYKIRSTFDVADESFAKIARQLWPELVKAKASATV